MRHLILLAILALGAIAQSQSLDFTTLGNYMSVGGRMRLLARDASGSWHDHAASRQIVLDLLPPAFSAECHYMSREGYARYVASLYWHTYKLPADEALVFVSRLYLNDRLRHRAGGFLFAKAP